MVVDPVLSSDAGARGRLVAHVRRALWVVLSLLGLVAFPYFVWLSHGSFGYDAHAFWSVDLGALYAGTAGNLNRLDAFRYAPPIAILFAPFSLLPWPVFLALWTGLLLGFIALLGGRRNALAIAGFPSVAMELHYGNINLLIGFCAAFGFAFPGLWAFVLLTKPTCAIALLWFVVRREWRALAWAFGIAILVALPTVVLRPDLWFSYVHMLTSDVDVPQYVPVTWRLPLAAAVVVWGALTNRRWTVPVGAMLAVPLLAGPQPAILAGVVPLLASQESRMQALIATATTGRTALTRAARSRLGLERPQPAMRGPAVDPDNS